MSEEYLYSKAAMTVLKVDSRRSALVLEYTKTLLPLSRMVKVHLIWLPEDSGVRENEEADRLVLRGSKRDP